MLDKDLFAQLLIIILMTSALRTLSIQACAHLGLRWLKPFDFGGSLPLVVIALAANAAVSVLVGGGSVLLAVVASFLAVPLLWLLLSNRINKRVGIAVNGLLACVASIAADLPLPLVALASATAAGLRWLEECLPPGQVQIVSSAWLREPATGLQRRLLAGFLAFFAIWTVIRLELGPEPLVDFFMRGHKADILEIATTSVFYWLICWLLLRRVP